MKTLIVYFSLEGNTKWAAERIASELNGDLLALTPKAAYPDKGFRKYFWGGKSSVMKEAPELEPYKTDLKNYERVVLAAPVWAGNFAPPLRTFIQSEDLTGKQLALVTCSGGGSPVKAFANLKMLLKVPGELPTLWLVSPREKPDQKNETAIEEFCRQLNAEKEDN